MHYRRETSIEDMQSDEGMLENDFEALDQLDSLDQELDLEGQELEAQLARLDISDSDEADVDFSGRLSRRNPSAAMNDPMTRASQTSQKSGGRVSGNRVSANGDGKKTARPPGVEPGTGSAGLATAAQRASQTSPQKVGTNQAQAQRLSKNQVQQAQRVSGNQEVEQAESATANTAGSDVKYKDKGNVQGKNPGKPQINKEDRACCC